MLRIDKILTGNHPSCRYCREPTTRFSGPTERKHPSSEKVKVFFAIVITYTAKIGVPAIPLAKIT
jgi:hypothetical protein